MTHTVLYSFRRCPYAMRARLAIASAGIQCELREILLRDKAPELLDASPKGTVPVIVTPETIIEESLDIMHWALAQNDPENWLECPESSHSLITRCDTEFKSALDTYKYKNSIEDRDKACAFLCCLDNMLEGQSYLFGSTPKIADMAILTFVRQFANVDKDWFDAQSWQNLASWLDAFTTSDRFAHIMEKYPRWNSGDTPIMFPTP